MTIEELEKEKEPNNIYAELMKEDKETLAMYVFILQKKCNKLVDYAIDKLVENRKLEMELATKGD